MATTIPSFILRAVTPADVDAFHAHAQDPVARRMVPPTRPPRTLAEHRAHWARVLADPATRNRTVACDGAAAGYIGLFSQEGVPSVAYWYDRAFWGRGLARHALARFLEEHPARPVFARVAKVNAASQGVLRANGFEVIGTDRYFSPELDREVDEFLLRLDQDGIGGAPAL